MKSKDRVEKALNHLQPDKVPLDFGGTSVTGIHASRVEALREYYGLEKRPVRVSEPYQFLGDIDDDLREAIGVDTVGIYRRNTLFGFANENWKEFKTPWGQVVLVSGHFVTSESPDGGIYIYPGGDTHAPPSGHMPSGGYFFDTIIRQEPLDESRLDPADNTEEFRRVTEDEIDYFQREAEKASATGRAVTANFGGTSLGDVALVPAPFLKRPKGIRDITEWYVSIASRPDYINEVFSRQCEIAIHNLSKMHGAVGDLVQVVFICGTDFGTQNSQFCSFDTFDSLYAPHYKKLNDWVHENTSWKTFKHCCGAVEGFMSRFIECGFDIINPVQISAKGMDPKLLKEKYGDRLVFWGGGVDTQKTLPFATPEEVRQEVLKLCGILSPGGGFVFNSVHNIQANVPVENIIAMIDAVKEFNGER